MMRKMLVVIMVILSLFSVSCSSNTQATGFDTPEDAVIAFLEGLRDSDSTRMSEAVTQEVSVDDFIGIFNELWDAPMLNTLEIIEFIPPEVFSEHYLSETNQENLVRQAERSGADNKVSRAVYFELDERKGLLFVDVLDYDGNWYIGEFGGNLSSFLFIAFYMQGIIPPDFVDEFLGE